MIAYEFPFLSLRLIKARLISRTRNWSVSHLKPLCFMGNFSADYQLQREGRTVIGKTQQQQEEKSRWSSSDEYFQYVQTFSYKHTCSTFRQTNGSHCDTRKHSKRTTRMGYLSLVVHCVTDHNVLCVTTDCAVDNRIQASRTWSHHTSCKCYRCLLSSKSLGSGILSFSCFNLRFDVL